MSFLNPVSLPVKRYSSTDEGAPQLEFTKVSTFKNVLKACLVTGYGAKSGAGWQLDATAETDTAIDLTSPAVAMQNDLLSFSANGNRANLKWVHKTGASRTRDFYTVRSFNNEISHGWEVLATDLGFYFVWDVTQNQQRSCLFVYYGQGKHGLSSNPSNNIVLLAEGITGGSALQGTTEVGQFGDRKLTLQSAVGLSFGTRAPQPALQVYDRVYLAESKQVYGLQPGLYHRGIADVAAYAPGVEDWDGRPVLSFYCGTKFSGQAFVIAMDYWEY